MRLALFQPDMAPNTGAMMRLCACFGVGMDIIEPCGFVWDERKIKRTGMDYRQLVAFQRHADWARFRAHMSGKRLVLLTTKAALPYHHFSFQADDILMVGQESAGVPLDVHQSVDAQIVIPMQPQARSLNVGMAAAIVLAEALRQTGHFR